MVLIEGRNRLSSLTTGGPEVDADVVGAVRLSLDVIVARLEDEAGEARVADQEVAAAAEQRDWQRAVGGELQPGADRGRGGRLGEVAGRAADA